MASGIEDDVAGLRALTGGVTCVLSYATVFLFGGARRGVVPSPSPCSANVFRGPGLPVPESNPEPRSYRSRPYAHSAGGERGPLLANPGGISL